MGKKKLPSVWTEEIFALVNNSGNLKIMPNYREVSFMDTGYKIHTRNIIINSQFP